MSVVSHANYEKILKEVLERITPSGEDKEKLELVAKKTLRIAKELAEKHNGKPMLVGSLTRNTWLADKKEFDVFILFPTKMSRKNLQSTGLKIGEEIINRLGGTYKIAYAEHPYVSGSYAGVTIDIVPCYEVKSADKLKSAVDRTPFHVRYIEKNLPETATGEVRLLKQFCKAQNVYGADVKTGGFSGYVCELLIINYKEFINVLNAAVGWKAGDIIDIKKFYKHDDYAKVRREFKEQPLILVDPIDEKRNTAAALSAENFYIFKRAASQFLSTPSKEFFFGKKQEPITEAELVKKQTERKTDFIMLKFAPPDVVPDILWPQLRRTADRLESILRENEFIVLRKDVYTNEKNVAAILLEMEVSKLPNVQKRIGPKIFDVDDAKSFLDKYKPQAIGGPFVENNFWAVEVRRKFLTARDKLMDSLKETEEILRAKGIPSHVAKEVAKNFELIDNTKKIIQLARGDEGFGIFLRKYFEKESLI